MLKPELQDKESFSEGINNIIETQRKVANLYFEDESYNDACPPLKALLKIMANPDDEKNLNSPEVRKLFDLENFLESDWYKERTQSQCKVDIKLWEKHYENLTNFISDPIYDGENSNLNIKEKLDAVKEKLKTAKDPNYSATLIGTIGVEPSVV